MSYTEHSQLPPTPPTTKNRIFNFSDFDQPDKKWNQLLLWTWRWNPIARRSWILEVSGMKAVPFIPSSMAAFTAFLLGVHYVCGHNIFDHDLKYIKNPVADVGILKIIDTLPLSPLLFPERPYHALLKDDKLQTDELNNPLNDAMKARDLFYDEVSAFHQADDAIKQVFYLLLKDQQQFRAFFDFLGYNTPYADLEKLIRQKFHDKICAHAPLHKMIVENPVALAYCLALVHCGNRYSITPPWVLRNYPAVSKSSLH